jgi:glycosyltransferase involved in cell wall biosynthesis
MSQEQVQPVYIYAPVSFEKWDHRSPDTTGIGGSETSVVEMGWRLARRGFRVKCYADIPDDCPREFRGTTWHRTEEADFSEPGTWIVYRNPAVADKFEPGPGRQFWLVCQDVDYWRDCDRFTETRIAKFDRILALCREHATYLVNKYPSMNSKVYVSSNGVKLEAVRQLDGADIRRNPRRILYASSPDRGLISLLRIFKRAREFERWPTDSSRAMPELELRVAYGFQNIDKIIEKMGKDSGWARDKARCEKLLNQPGVTFLGRLSQPDLMREWFAAGLMVYPTTFTETNCIAVQECQACGCIPVCSPVWALGEKLRGGVHIEGDPENPMVRARFVNVILRMAANAEAQEAMRTLMRQRARIDFGWERVADQWEAAIRGYDNRCYVSQFGFQLRHATGSVLNLGCNTDPAKFGECGAINVDAYTVDPHTGGAIPAHVVADIRRPIPDLGVYDSVILGDVLEHMTDEDAVATLSCARSYINGHGKVLVTVPEDHRPPGMQHMAPDQIYPTGESAYHERPITRETVLGWLSAAGMHEIRHEEIDYGFCTGHGVIAC